MLPISEIWLVLSQAILVIQTEKKEMGISWAGCGWGWVVFQSQSEVDCHRSLCTVPSAFQSCCSVRCDSLCFTGTFHGCSCSCDSTSQEKRRWIQSTVWLMNCRNLPEHYVIFCDFGTQFPFFLSVIVTFPGCTESCMWWWDYFISSFHCKDFLKSVLFWLHFPFHSFLSSACLSILFFPSSITHLSFLFWFIWNAAALTAWVQHFLYLQLSYTQPLL